jgi:flavin-binding protein dodecin
LDADLTTRLVIKNTSTWSSNWENTNMSIARITEISSTSTKSFEDAIQSGVNRATTTLRNVRSAWVKEQQIRIDNGTIVEYQVNLMITFVLDEGDETDVA